MTSLQNSLVQSSSPRGTTAAASYQASGCISWLLSQRCPANAMVVFSVGGKFKLACLL